MTFPHATSQDSPIRGSHLIEHGIVGEGSTSCERRKLSAVKREGGGSWLLGIARLKEQQQKEKKSRDRHSHGYLRSDDLTVSNSEGRLAGSGAAAARDRKLWDCKLQCKHCARRRDPDAFAPKQWSKARPCCLDCAADREADAARIAECVGGRAMLRAATSALACARCGVVRPAAAYCDGLFTAAVAYREGIRLGQRLSPEADPFVNAVCFYCRPIKVRWPVDTRTVRPLYVPQHGSTYFK